MKLFHKKNSCCSIETNTLKNLSTTKNTNGIKILGSGCPKCISLENATKSALNELNFNLEIEHITDFAQIASFGIMTTPALVLNNEVISYGKVLTVKEIKELLIQKLEK